jgi:hypothetical protein
MSGPESGRLVLRVDQKKWPGFIFKTFLYAVCFLYFVFYVWMTIFKSIHMAFYGNTSWACALFRNNKQHVVLGQKRNCQHDWEKTATCSAYLLTIIKHFLEFAPSNGNGPTDPIYPAFVPFGRYFTSAWLLLIGKPSMLPSFLNRFSYFMNSWWCLWSFSVDINQYM